MCGIAGLFLPRGALPVNANLGAMLSVMHHRGPDGTASYVSDDGLFQAAFRRLAIIDLETGDQPIIEGSGRRVLMGNGEIYNYLELREEEGTYFYQTSGDMEVVLPLATRHGDDFVHKLNGMFALALYERDSHSLFLVRDRLGVKPLYWSRLGGGGIVFASEIKALFASGLVAPEVNDAAVSSYLSHGYVPAPQTLFAGVNKLAPGHTLKADAHGTVKVERYWQARPASGLPRRSGEVEEYLIDLLRDSVRLRLRSDVAVGALLSGGIDSGLMCALAAEALDEPLKTYTVSFEGAAVNEATLAESVARRYGTNHTHLDLPAGDVAQTLPRLAWYAEEPLNDAALLPNYLINQVLAAHVTVALNGTGGDEIFAGYGRYFQLPVESLYSRLPDFFCRRLVAPAVGAFSPMTAWKLARAAKFDGNRGDYLHDHTTHFPPPMRALIGNTQALPAPAQAAFFDQFSGDPQADPQAAALYADINTYLPDDLLTLLDRTTMAVSVEGRVPFLDYRLVEAALAIPPALRTPGGRPKGLERAMASRFLPEAVVTAPKQGFASPVPAWLKAGLAPVARKLLTRAQSLDRGWWTAAGIDRLLADPDRHGFRVYTLIMLELAVRIHVETAATKEPPSEGLEALAHAA